MFLTAALAAVSLMPVLTQGDPYTAKLLKVGAMAPDASITTTSGTKTKLSAIWKKNKGTVLNFWFVH